MERIYSVCCLSLTAAALFSVVALGQNEGDHSSGVPGTLTGQRQIDTRTPREQLVELFSKKEFPSSSAEIPDFIASLSVEQSRELFEIFKKKATSFFASIGKPVPAEALLIEIAKALEAKNEEALARLRDPRSDENRTFIGILADHTISLDPSGRALKRLNQWRELARATSKENADPKNRKSFYLALAQWTGSLNEIQRQQAAQRLDTLKVSTDLPEDSFIRRALLDSFNRRAQANQGLTHSGEDADPSAAKAVEASREWNLSWNHALREIVHIDGAKPKLDLDRKVTYTDIDGKSHTLSGKDWIDQQIRDFGYDGLVRWAASVGGKTGARTLAMIAAARQEEGTAGIGVVPRSDGAGTVTIHADTGSGEQAHNLKESGELVLNVEQPLPDQIIHLLPKEDSGWENARFVPVTELPKPASGGEVAIFRAPSPQIDLTPAPLPRAAEKKAETVPPVHDQATVPIGGGSELHVKAGRLEYAGNAVEFSGARKLCAAKGQKLPDPEQAKQALEEIRGELGKSKDLTRLVWTAIISPPVSSYFRLNVDTGKEEDYDPKKTVGVWCSPLKAEAVEPKKSSAPKVGVPKTSLEAPTKTDARVTAEAKQRRGSAGTQVEDLAPPPNVSSPGTQANPNPPAPIQVPPQTTVKSEEGSLAPPPPAAPSPVSPQTAPPSAENKVHGPRNRLEALNDPEVLRELPRCLACHLISEDTENVRDIPGLLYGMRTMGYGGIIKMMGRGELNHIHFTPGAHIKLIKAFADFPNMPPGPNEKAPPPAKIPAPGESPEEQVYSGDSARAQALKAPEVTAGLARCLSCHQAQDGTEGVNTLSKLRAAMRTIDEATVKNMIDRGDKDNVIIHQRPNLEKALLAIAKLPPDAPLTPEARAQLQQQHLHHHHHHQEQQPHSDKFPNAQLRGPVEPPPAAPVEPTVLSKGRTSIHLIVPPGALVFFDGEPTQQTGTFRLYSADTVGLNMAKNYTYQLKVVMNYAGRTYTFNKTIRFKPGKPINLRVGFKRAPGQGTLSLQEFAR